MKTKSKRPVGRGSRRAPKSASKKGQDLARQLSAFTRYIRRDLAPLLGAGATLSDIAHRISYYSTLTEADRRSLKEARKAWDVALTKIPTWMLR